MTSTENITRGVHHVGITVPNLAQTRDFFIDTLGFDRVGDVPDYPAVFLNDGGTMITIWQASDPATCVAFDRKNVVGLHHFALLVDNHDALNSLYETLQSTENIVIEFAPEPLGTGNVRHMMTEIPGGVRVEFLSPGP